MAILPKTRELISKEIAPKLANILPSLRPTKKDKNEVENRLADIENVQEMIVKKMSEEKQFSGAFDYYHQTSPSSVAPNVLNHYFGRDLHFLRQYYQVCSPIDQLIFGKRFDQLRALSDCVADNPKKIGWRVVHKQQDSPKFRVTNEIEKHCRWFEELIQSPNSARHPGKFPDVLVAMAESKMLFDRVPIEKCEHLNYKGYGRPASYLIPDAATIKPTTWVLHAMAGASGYSGKNGVEQARSIVSDSQQTAQQLLSYNTQVREVAKQLVKKNNNLIEQTEYERLMSGVIEWVQQMPDQLISAGYTRNNISVFIGNHSPQVNAWGWSSGSSFERSFAFGEVIFKMTGYNQEIFDSRMPEGLLTIVNSGVDKKQKQQLHERMYEEGSDRYNNMLVHYVNDPEKDIKYTRLRDKPHDMQFKDMFILYVKLKCAAYGFDYTELNLEDGKSSGQGGSGSHEKRMDNQAATGIRSDTRYHAHCLTEALIAPWSKDYKMEFVHDVTETEDEVKLKKEKMSYTSIYETRVEDNLEEEWWNDAPKEYREELKEYGKYSYIPGLTDAGRVQLIVKDKDLAAQKEMQEQAEDEEKQVG
ncbi:hypothetical protein KAR91_68800, partial [Candidatus Pacearchaeota archaeon]|nr:hypothetical protein [Candidatus Pacearchaeota archaeon]